MKKRVFIVLYLFIQYGCDIPAPVVPDVPQNNIVLTTVSDFSTGFIAALDTSLTNSYRDIRPVHSDAVIRYKAGMVFVLNRLGADNITRFQPETGFVPLYETSLGSKSNPQDIAIINNRWAIVSLYGKNYLQLVDFNSGQLLQKIDISDYADNDGLSEAAAMYVSGTNLYVALQRLNRNIVGQSIWPPVGDSLLLKINTTTLNIENSWVLPFSNPISEFRFNATRNSIAISCVGIFTINSKLDGGIIEFNLATETFTILLTEQEIGFEIIDFVFSTASTGFLIGQDSNLTSILASFDIDTKKITKTMSTLSSTAGGYFSGLAVSRADVLFVGDRSTANSGIRIFSAKNLTELKTTAISVGLPPISMVIVE